LSDDPVDTGFDAVAAGEVYTPPEPELTVTVNPEPSLPSPVPSPAATEGLTPAGVEAAKALVQLPKHLDWPTLAMLAREVAMNIKERSTILNDFKITQVQYDFLETHNEFYRAALAQACKEWHGPLTTQERIGVEAAAILEDSLLVLGARMQNKGEGLPGVVEAAKLFAKIAGVGERATNQAAPGERFTINIDLGGDKSLTIDTKAAAPQSPLRLLPGDLEEE
jgi:hypothetical protein